MKAKVTQEFPGRPDKEARTRTITVGEVIEGELAEVAVREKWAKVVKEEPKPAEKAEQHSEKTGDPAEAQKKTAEEGQADDKADKPADDGEKKGEE